MDLRPDWFDIRVFQGSGLSSDPSTEVGRAPQGKKVNFINPITLVWVSFIGFIEEVTSWKEPI